jgi:ankyrin repeat protein
MEMSMRGWGTRLGLAALMVAAPLAAQRTPGTGSTYEPFLAAVRNEDGNKVVEMVEKNGKGVVNYRGEDGSTGLTIAAQRRLPIYLSYLLSSGADPDLPNGQGDTALIIAVRQGWDEGIDTLLANKARPDATNRLGETPLIVAVQAHQLGAARKLLKAGADPDKSDRAAGYSARDYAKRDRRSAEILKLIEAAGTPSGQSGPTAAARRGGRSAAAPPCAAPGQAAAAPPLLL